MVRRTILAGTAVASLAAAAAAWATAQQYNGPAGATPRARVELNAVLAQRRFKATTTVNGGRVTAKITGRFSRSFAKATGTLHVTGAVPGCASADTGVVTWSAPKVGPAG
jgi:hypothetical protein